jgi:hypothetical protein
VREPGSLTHPQVTPTEPRPDGTFERLSPLKLPPEQALIFRHIRYDIFLIWMKGSIQSHIIAFRRFSSYHENRC